MHADTCHSESTAAAMAQSMSVAVMPKSMQEERVQFYLRAGKYSEAIETAVALRNDDLLAEITKYGHAHGRRDIDQLVASATQ